MEDGDYVPLQSQRSRAQCQHVRPRSAMLEPHGMQDPSIHMSASPHFTLGHRPKKRRVSRVVSNSRLSNNYKDVIVISDDSDSDLTRGLESSHKPIILPPTPGDSVGTMLLDAPQPSKHARRPPWLSVELSKIRKAFPSIRCEHLRTSDGGIEWYLVCLLCVPDKPFNVGSENDVTIFVAHAQEAHGIALDGQSSQDENVMLTPRSAETLPPISMAESSTAYSSPAGTTDIISQFLVEQALSTSFAQALHRVGIVDRSRICRLGALPDADLDKLETKLASEGLDFVACLLVRVGLRRYARKASRKIRGV